MNIVLFDETQKIDGDFFTLTARQSQHLNSVVKAKPGDSIRIGLLNGKIGQGLYLGAEVNQIQVVSLAEEPPKELPLTLVLALPRPNMLKRTLLNIATMGVKNIIILNSAKVEKSYWQSPVLEYENLQNILKEGLEQAKDTILPSLQLIPRFRPFVEDLIPDMSKGKQCLLAHPYHAKACPVSLQGEAILAIGPEGGWNEFEVEKWEEAGFQSVHLGERILKVETAVPVLLSRLYPAGI